MRGGDPFYGSSGGIWQDDDGTRRYLKMRVSLYFEVFSSVLPQSFYGLLCSPDRLVIELIPVRILRLYY